MSPSYQELARAPLCQPSERASQDGRSSSDLDKFDDDGLEDGHTISQTLRSRRTLSAAIVAPWMLVAFCLISILYWHWKGPSDLECTRQLNPYCIAPLIEKDLVEYHDLNFNNSFAHDTKYRGPPTPQLELEWNRLWDRGAVEVPLVGAVKLNRTPEELSHVHKDDSRGYSSLLEVFHQIHCLNLIRQYTWKDYFKEHLHEFKNDQQLLDLGLTHEFEVGDRMHVDHCIETLRLTLMCQADVTPMLILKDPSKETGTSADFNTFHKCRNFDRILEWQDQHNADKDN